MDASLLLTSRAAQPRWGRSSQPPCGLPAKCGVVDDTRGVCPACLGATKPLSQAFAKGWAGAGSRIGKGRVRPGSGAQPWHHSHHGIHWPCECADSKPSIGSSRSQHDEALNSAQGSMQRVPCALCCAGIVNGCQRPRTQEQCVPSPCLDARAALLLEADACLPSSLSTFKTLSVRRVEKLGKQMGCSNRRPQRVKRTPRQGSAAGKPVSSRNLAPQSASFPVPSAAPFSDVYLCCRPRAALQRRR